MNATNPHAEDKRSTKQDFMESIKLFSTKKFAEACVKFKLLLEVNPEYKVVQLYLNLSAK